MGTKETFKKTRDALQQIIYSIINPLVKGMIKIGITPNIVTTIGFLGNVASACIIVYAAFLPVTDLSLLGWAGLVLLLSSLFDMMDGQVARIGNMASTFGAMYDSVLDRYSELVTLGSICYFFILQQYPVASLLTFIALIGSVMVSYVRARAEGLDIECKIGLMQRPERVVLTSLGAIFCGVFSNIESFDPALILIVPICIIAVFANITAFARVIYCKKQIEKVGK